MNNEEFIIFAYNIGRNDGDSNQPIPKNIIQYLKDLYKEEKRNKIKVNNCPEFISECS